MRALRVVLLVVAAACGDGGQQPPDAPASDGGQPDAPSFPACAEFAAAAIDVPAHVVSALDRSDVASPAQCASVDAPFGVESAGPDRVIPLRGLTAGMTYVVRVVSLSDLGFYVVTGCSTETGPAADQCLLFQDGSTADREVGTFVADGPTAFVVVDFYAPTSPPSLDFTLDVYPQRCQGTGATAACASPTPACFEGQCVACVTSFDCDQPGLSVCGANHTCSSGDDTCPGDTATEPDDDGPAGAIAIVPDGLGTTILPGALCSSPRTEPDYFAFDVTTLGERWDVTLSWSGGRDLDLQIYDDAGNDLGMSYWEQPEHVQLTYLPIGRYYARVREFVSTPDPSTLSYTLTTQRTYGAACATAADCAGEYRNQVFRGQCLAGACQPIDGAGAVLEGGACDSMSDCAPNLSCPSFFFVADADTRETCARSCTTDAACAALGAGYVCTTYLSTNFCVPACTQDDHCPTSISLVPSTGPWARLRCDVPTGRCQP